MGVKALNEEQMGQVIKTLNRYLEEHFTKQEQRHELRRDEDYDDETEDQLLDEVSFYFFSFWLPSRHLLAFLSSISLHS